MQPIGPWKVVSIGACALCIGMSACSDGGEERAAATGGGPNAAGGAGASGGSTSATDASTGSGGSASGAGPNIADAATADDSAAPLPQDVQYPLPSLPPNTITDAILTEGEMLYRTADDLRIAADYPAAFDIYVELMLLLQGPVGPLAAQAHRIMARAEHDLGGLSRWRIERDIVIGLQHYRASVAHCEVGGCDAVAMGSVARVTQFEQEIAATGAPIPPWEPPVY